VRFPVLANRFKSTSISPANKGKHILTLSSPTSVASQLIVITVCPATACHEACDGITELNRRLDFRA
jgi:hypothetical protein